MLTTYLIGRELLRRKRAGAGSESAAEQGAAAAATPEAAAAPGDVGAAAEPLLQPALDDDDEPAEVLQLPVQLEADDSRGLFRLHFGARRRSRTGGGSDGGGGSADGDGDAAAAAAGHLPEGWAGLLEEGEQLVEALGASIGQQLRLDELKHPASGRHERHPTLALAGSSSGGGGIGGEAGGVEGDGGEAGAEGGDGGASGALPIPKLDIVILVCGTRGDVQPFIALGRGLAAAGHRVRLASHAVYRDFVTRFGLEFYPLGGDPEVLSEFIVRNRGVVPKATELPLALRSTEQVKAVLQSCYAACTAPDPGDPRARPFTAQAIIANPPSYGHIHCAEKLGVPLHLCFPMPWTPTAEFACPLSTLSLPHSPALNKLSWGVVFDFIWSGMLHMLNSWRQHELGLPPIRTGNSGGLITHVHKVPFMYCWSEAVVPKPADWPAFTDVVGYFFLDEGQLSAYRPPAELEAFLAAGPPPVYVGFGSLVLDDPAGLTRTVVEAGAAAGVRLLISKGWGGLGEGLEAGALPGGVLLLDKPCPHDWLFKRCTGVVHHGGAGTTAAGIKAGLPTAIVPFFGDQHYWGAAVQRKGLGPAPCPVDKLTTERLVGMLRTLHEPGVRAAAAAAAAQIAQEDGVAAAVACFHRHLPLARLVRGERVEWDLAAPQVSNVFYEAGAGVINLVKRPIKGAKRDGVRGALVGAGRGLLDLNCRPIKGLVLSGQALRQQVAARPHGGGGGGDGGGDGSEGEAGQEAS